MTRAEAYAEGFHEGQRWAEEDIRNRPVGSNEIYLDVRFSDGPMRAFALGRRRGYRDTWARWDAGTLTWEQLEHAPLGRAT